MRRSGARALFYVLLIATLFGTFFYMRETPLCVDEDHHQRQIDSYLRGDFRQDGAIPQIPGYHVVMASLLWLIDDPSLQAARRFDFAFGLASILLFALTLKKIHGRVHDVRVLQYVYFPLVLPFFFLNYTEIFSLLFVLLGLYCGLCRRYFLSGLACVLSVLVRQNNIIWLVMIPLLLEAQEDRWPREVASIFRLLRRYWISLLGIIAFAVFVKLNGGVAIGDTDMHPSGKLYSGNVFLLLFLYCGFFLPSICTHYRRIANFAVSSRYMPLLVAVLLSVYIFNFRVDHYYNSHEYFLRNRLLHYFTETLLKQLVFFLPILLAALDIVTNPLCRRIFLVLYPFTALFLLPSWLIEPRYTLIPFVFLFLFRKYENPAVENATAVIWIALSVVLLQGIKNIEVFL